MTCNNTKHGRYSKIRTTPPNHKPYTKTLMIFFRLQENLSVTPKSFVVKYQASISRKMEEKERKQVLDCRQHVIASVNSTWCKDNLLVSGNIVWEQILLQHPLLYDSATLFLTPVKKRLCTTPVFSSQLALFAIIWTRQAKEPGAVFSRLLVRSKDRWERQSWNSWQWI